MGGRGVYIYSLSVIIKVNAMIMIFIRILNLFKTITLKKTKI